MIYLKTTAADRTQGGRIENDSAGHAGAAIDKTLVRSGVSEEFGCSDRYRRERQQDEGGANQPQEQAPARQRVLPHFGELADARGNGRKSRLVGETRRAEHLDHADQGRCLRRVPDPSWQSPTAVAVLGRLGPASRPYLFATRQSDSRPISPSTIYEEELLSDEITNNAS